MRQSASEPIRLARAWSIGLLFVKICFLTLLLLLPVPQSARGEDAAADEGGPSWFKDRITFRGQVLPLLNVQQLLNVPNNPNNNFFKLERYSWELNLRPDIGINLDALKLGLSPRLVSTYKVFEDGTQAGMHSLRTDVFLNEGYAQINPFAPLVISLERKNMQWGPAFLISPSNPFYKTTGKTRPDQELQGKDFVRVSYIPNDTVALHFLANFGSGEYSVQGSMEKFEKVFALRGDITLDRLSLSPVLSFEERDRPRGGGYANWTVSDAVLLYGDFTVAKGTKGRYVEPSSDSPTGLEFTPSFANSGRFFLDALGGGSYTFADGTSINLEYLYYGEGYSSAYASRYFKLLQSVTGDFLYQGTNSSLLRLQNFATGQLYFAYQNNLALLRRDYLMMCATRNDIGDRLNLTGGAVVNLDDRSFYTFAFVDLKLTNTLRAFINNLYYFGGNNTENHTNLRYILTSGLRYFF